MPIYIQDVEQRRVGEGIVPYYDNEEQFPASFPIHLWGTQAARYLEYWRQFTGLTWTEEIPNTVDENGNPHLRYPLQINYLKAVCMKHSYVLWGEVADGPYPLAPIKCKAREDVDAIEGATDKDQADETLRKNIKKCQAFINRVWMQNDGRALQQEGGLTQAYLGGYVLRIGWSPDDPELEYGIRLENVLPDFFLPVWDNGHPDTLLEAWVVYRMPAREASERFNFALTEGMSDPLYVEHWTRDKVNITLAGKPLVYTINGVTLNYDEAPNPFGFVPYQYIPRERAGGFYGLSLLDDLLGIAKELNARVADMGDIVAETAHRELFISNVAQAPKTQDIGGTRPAINLGFQTPGSAGEPTAWAIEPPNITAAVADYPEYLRKQLQRDAFVPGVADGEDEGSQRSALTLAFRMWPLTAKVRAVRTYWTVGLIHIAKKILKMGIIKGTLKGIDLSIMNQIDWSVDWSPMIPRDREQQLNEVVLAEQTNMLSPIDGMNILGLVDDPVAAYQRTQAHITWLLGEQAKAAAAGKASQEAGSVKPPQTKTASPPVETIMSEPKG